MNEEKRKKRNKKIMDCTKKAMQEGRIKQVLLRLKTEDAEEFDEIAKELNLSRSELIKYLCKIHKESKKRANECKD